MGIALFFMFVLMVSAFAPQYILFFLALNLVVGVFLSIVQMIIVLFPRAKPKRCVFGAPPFVSILVPAYNEPPTVLIQTIEVLSRLKYDHFEVLIIDNNTQDSSIWKPVQAFVETLDKRFKFLHVEQLPGFKAGALNYVLRYVNIKSEYIAVIDADYLVEPDFLVTALSYFSDKKIALVQFPQKYRNVNDKNLPIADEYSHFFEIYMNMANYLDCVPSTGTVSMYRLDALRKIGGFRGEALTEDADVGLRLYGSGYKGVYIDHPVGYGLMPYDLESYRKQKWRWAFGNVQSLKTLVLLFGKIPFRSWIGFLSHLTAWHHFHFLPFAVLAAFPIVLHPAIPITRYHKDILIIASLSILLTWASKFLLFLVTLRGRKYFFIRAIRAFFVHMGMTLVYSEAWIAFFLGRKFAFERTNKFILQKMPSLLKNSYGELLLGIWYLLGAAVSIVWGKPIMIIAFLVAASTLFATYYVYWKIKPTRDCSERMLSDLDLKYKEFLPIRDN